MLRSAEQLEGLIGAADLEEGIHKQFWPDVNFDDFHNLIVTGELLSHMRNPKIEAFKDLSESEAPHGASFESRIVEFPGTPEGGISEVIESARLEILKFITIRRVFEECENPQERSVTFESLMDIEDFRERYLCEEIFHIWIGCSTSSKEVEFVVKKMQAEGFDVCGRTRKLIQYKNTEEENKLSLAGQEITAAKSYNDLIAVLGLVEEKGIFLDDKRGQIVKDRFEFFLKKEKVPERKMDLFDGASERLSEYFEVEPLVISWISGIRSTELLGRAIARFGTQIGQAKAGELVKCHLEYLIRGKDFQAKMAVYKELIQISDIACYIDFVEEYRALLSECEEYKDLEDLLAMSEGKAFGSLEPDFVRCLEGIACRKFQETHNARGVLAPLDASSLGRLTHCETFYIPLLKECQDDERLNVIFILRRMQAVNIEFTEKTTQIIEDRNFLPGDIDGQQLAEFIQESGELTEKSKECTQYRERIRKERIGKKCNEGSRELQLVWEEERKREGLMKKAVGVKRELTEFVDAMRSYLRFVAECAKIAPMYNEEGQEVEGGFSPSEAFKLSPKFEACSGGLNDKMSGLLNRWLFRKPVIAFSGKAFATAYADFLKRLNLFSKGQVVAAPSVLAKFGFMDIYNALEGKTVSEVYDDEALAKLKGPITKEEVLAQFMAKIARLNEDISICLLRDDEEKMFIKEMEGFIEKLCALIDEGVTLKPLLITSSRELIREMFEEARVEAIQNPEATVLNIYHQVLHKLEEPLANRNGKEIRSVFSDSFPGLIAPCNRWNLTGVLKLLVRSELRKKGVTVKGL